MRSPESKAKGAARSRIWRATHPGYRREANAAYSRAYRAAHPDYQKEYHRLNRDTRLAKAKRYRLVNKKTIQAKNTVYRHAHPEWVREVGTRCSRKLRIEVLTGYGGTPPKCSCCNEIHEEFLCIDHINGGGRKHRETLNISEGHNFYRWLRKNKFPEGFRVLCHNCNASYGHYGYCPHKKGGSSV